MKPVTTAFLFLAMLLSAEAIDDCSVRGIMHNHIKHRTKSHHRTLAVAMPLCTKHRPKASDVRKAERLLLEFSSKNNATMKFRVRANESQTSWLTLGEIGNVGWLRDASLRDASLRDVVVEHRVVFENGTSAESQMHLNMSTAKDLMAGEFSRNLLSVWDALLVITVICVTVALLGVASLAFDGIIETVVAGNTALWPGGIVGVVATTIGISAQMLAVWAATVSLLGNEANSLDNST
jgi:hypothetical protein